MTLKIYEIINLEQGIDELIKYDLSFPFNISLSLMRNKKNCEEITILFFQRMSKIFDNYDKLLDSSLRNENESFIYNEALNVSVDIDIKKLFIDDIKIENDIKVKLSLFKNLNPMLLDL